MKQGLFGLKWAYKERHGKGMKVMSLGDKAPWFITKSDV